MQKEKEYQERNKMPTTIAGTEGDIKANGRNKMSQSMGFIGETA